MRIILFLWGAISFLAGFGETIFASTVVHQACGFILLLMSAVCISGAAIIEAINRVQQEVKSGREKEGGNP